MKNVVLGILTTVITCASAAFAGATALNTNLVINGGAEQSYRDAQGHSVIPGWTPASSVFQVYSYSSLSGTSDKKAGSLYFYSGTQNEFATGSYATQDIDISDLAASVDSLAVNAHIDGILYNYFTLTAFYLDSAGQTISALNAPSGQPRGYQETFGTIPKGTRKIRLRIGDRGEGDVINVVIYPKSAPNSLLNISTRGFVGSNDNALICGIIITGGTQKHVVFRAIGPTLQNFGVTGALADPTLQLFDANGQMIAFNDDWQSDSQASAVQASGLAPADPRESALSVTLDSGVYTAIVRGKSNTGVAVVEAYDIDQSGFSNFANISTRDQVLTGNGVMIAGFIMSGGTAKKITARGIGPSLSKSGVPNVLADPQLDVRDSMGQPYYSNDNWQDTSSEATETRAEGLAPSDPKEAVVSSMRLPPGSYTVILQGANAGTGNGLVELYDLGQYPK